MVQNIETLLNSYRLLSTEDKAWGKILNDAKKNSEKLWQEYPEAKSRLNRKPTTSFFDLIKKLVYRLKTGEYPEEESYNKKYFEVLSSSLVGDDLRNAEKKLWNSYFEKRDIRKKINKIENQYKEMLVFFKESPEVLQQTLDCGVVRAQEGNITFTGKICGEGYEARQDIAIMHSDVEPLIKEGVIAITNVKEKVGRVGHILGGLYIKKVTGTPVKKAA